MILHQLPFRDLNVLDYKKQGTHMQSLPPNPVGDAKPGKQPTGMKATDPARIGWGLWDPRGEKAGLGMKPSWKVSHRRCCLSACEAQWWQTRSLESGHWLIKIVLNL